MSLRSGIPSSFQIKRSSIRKGMVMVSPRLNPQASWEFEAEILVLHHPTTISPRYQAMGRCLRALPAQEAPALDPSQSAPATKTPKFQPEPRSRSPYCSVMPSILPMSCGVYSVLQTQTECQLYVHSVSAECCCVPGAARVRGTDVMGKGHALRKLTAKAHPVPCVQELGPWVPGQVGSNWRHRQDQMSEQPQPTRPP